ncbi:hypothetical protein MKX01_020625 [Papaver californicum]|nr:hypothetical protein MKX01_020625 [Papaver californicum]
MGLQLRVSSLTKTTPSLLSSHNQSFIYTALLLSPSPGIRVCKFASPRSSTRSRQITTTRCLFGKGVVPAADDVVEGVLDGVATSIRSISQPDRVKRDDFPLDFKFEASTSALQTEGSGSEGGRGPSTWDSFLQDFSVEGTETATNSYHKYKDDVKALKEMGMDAYRMSISWSRHSLAAQGGEMGISIVGHWFVPHSDSSRDKEAAERDNDFMVGWFMEPLVYGDYPFIMRALVRDNLPMFADKEKELVKGSYDFIGVNYYTARYGKDIPFTGEHKFTSTDKYQFCRTERYEYACTTISYLTWLEKNGVPIGPLPPAGGSESIYIYPAGLRDVLVYMKERYDNPKLYVTENGIPEGRDDSQPMEKALEDTYRIEVILSHLYAVREAMKKGVNMKGFFIWALLDCMEMGSAYNVRFGLHYTDYKNDCNGIQKNRLNGSAVTSRLIDCLKNRQLMMRWNGTRWFVNDVYNLLLCFVIEMVKFGCYPKLVIM